MSAQQSHHLLSSTAVPELYVEDSTPPANPGFFYRSSNIDASRSNFTDITANKVIIHGNGPNENSECLNKLPHATKAGYSSKPHRTCLEGTRKEVLQEIEMWEVDKMDMSVYWLKGGAGYGKSTIAQTFAERSAKNGRLGASFFCSRDFPDRRNLQLIFPTLAHGLAHQFPSFMAALIPIINSNPHVEQDALGFQLEKLLVRPLKETGLSFTIVVDALDECVDKDPVSGFLSALAQYVDEIPAVKFFITGRPEDHIRYGFLRLRTKELPLHGINSATVDSDIKSYVKSELEEIARRRKGCIHGSWPSDKEIGAILDMSSGLFIIASTIIRFVDYRRATPQERLKRILDTPTSTIYEGESGIDSMYYQILSAGLLDVDDSEDDREYFNQLRNVVGSIVLALNPLSCTSLAKILKMSTERIYNILSCLHSVLIVPESDSGPIMLCHKSFADFITDLKRCRDARYHIDAPVQHSKFGGWCLGLMKTTLTKNICHLPRYSMNNDIEDLPTRREQYIGAALAYACSSWAKHLQLSFGAGDTDYTIGLVNYLLKTHFLSWLEVLSIEGSFHVSVYSIRDIRLWLTDAGSLASSPFDLIYECERFILRFFDVMERSAMHIYHSALPWSPTSSIIREIYGKDLKTEARLLNAVDATWPACDWMVSVGGFRDWITFSHNGALIAACDPEGVKTFDIVTGAIRASFDMYISSSTAFSPDDSLLASGSTSVRVWDLQTGNLVRRFEGHRSTVKSVAFSPCGAMIASGSRDGTIRVWSMSSGCCLCVLEDHSGDVWDVCWSSTGDRVISGSQDRTVRVWDASKGTCSKILGENKPVTAVASSHASFLAASDDTVKVYDLRSYDVIHTISLDHLISSVRFSIDGGKIMYTSRGAGVIMDLASKSHVSSISYDGNLARFSPDGSCIASEGNRLMRLWRQSDGGHQHGNASVHQINTERVEGIFFSPNGNVAASTHESCIKFWDATTGTCLFSSGIFHRQRPFSKSKNMVVFSPNSAFGAYLKHDAVWIFDLRTRTLVKFLKIPCSAEAIAVSSDGSRLVSLIENLLILWDLRKIECLACLDHIPSYRYSISVQLQFTVDGNSVFIGVDDGTYCWHICPASPSGHKQFASPPMAFVPIPQERSRPRISFPSLHYAQHSDRDWIVDHDRRRVLWLPQDKRDSRLARSSGKKIILVIWTEKVYIFDFSHVLLFDGADP